MANAELSSISQDRAQLSGDLLNNTVVAVIEPGKKLMAAAAENWTLDMVAVERVSSAGVALLLEWLRYARSRNLEFKIENLPSHMQPIIRVSDLEPLFEPLLS